MVVKASDQSKRNFCIAIFNRHLNSKGICPANHSVDYYNGWFRKDDGEPFQNPEWTAEADAMMREKTHTILYWQEANTYVLGDFYDE